MVSLFVRHCVSITISCTSVSLMAPVPCWFVKVVLKMSKPMLHFSPSCPADVSAAWVWRTKKGPVEWRFTAEQPFYIRAQSKLHDDDKQQHLNIPAPHQLLCFDLRSCSAGVTKWEAMQRCLPGVLLRLGAAQESISVCLNWKKGADQWRGCENLWHWNGVCSERSGIKVREVRISSFCSGQMERKETKKSTTFSKAH